MDILDRDAALPDYDYVVTNGVFNYRGELSREANAGLLEAN